MPSSATITTFYTFAPDSRARASQVNENFSQFRGHFIPIAPNSQTSANLTYDIGSEEYRWRTGWFGNINLGPATTSGYPLVIDGTAVSSSLIYNYTPTLGGVPLHTSAQAYPNAPAIQVIINSVMAFEVTQYGIPSGSISRDAISKVGITDYANDGSPGFAVQSDAFTKGINYSAGTNSAGPVIITLSAIKVSFFRGNSLVQCGLIPGSVGGTTMSGGYVETYAGGVGQVSAQIGLYRGSTADTIGASTLLYTWLYKISGPNTTATDILKQDHLPGLSGVFSQVGTTEDDTEQYFLALYSQKPGGGSGEFNLVNARLIMRELL